MPTLLEAREQSLANGLGNGVRPRQVFAVELTFTPPGERKKRWVMTCPTKADAKRVVERIKKYPAENESVVLLVGKVEWAEEPTN